MGPLELWQLHHGALVLLSMGLANGCKWLAARVDCVQDLARQLAQERQEAIQILQLVLAERKEKEALLVKVEAAII